MRLTDLSPQFVRYGIGGGDVNSLAEAHGIRFLCPKCIDAGKTGIGVHQCGIAFEGRSDESPVRWTVAGNDFTDLSTTPSIQVIGGCRWHGFIANGVVSVI